MFLDLEHSMDLGQIKASDGGWPVHNTLFGRPHSGSPFGLPAIYPPPGAFTRPLPDSWGSPDSYSSKKSTKNHECSVEKSKFPFLHQGHLKILEPFLVQL